MNKQRARIRRLGGKSLVAAAAMAVVATITSVGVQAQPDVGEPTVSILTSGIVGVGGSTIGPDGALYAASTAGEIIRIDLDTGAQSVWASGLPPAVAPIGGPTDIVFHGGTAYVLVSLVGEFFGNNDVNGVYRIDGPTEHTVIADLGQWALDNPPSGFAYFIPTGVHYAIETFRNDLIVTDGHHNRLISVSRAGDISLMSGMPNIVPTGLDVHGNDVLLGLAGEAPHLPEDGKMVAVNARSGERTAIASGAPLLVDVERGRGHLVFGLAQGDFPDGSPDGSPALPGTGLLMLAEGDTFVPVVDGLNLPTSMEIVGDTAYIVGLDGVVTKVDHLPKPGRK